MTRVGGANTTRGARDERVPALVERINPDKLQQRRWFGSKSKQIKAITTYDHALLSEQPAVADALVEVRFTDGSAELYQIPLLLADADDPSAGAQPFAEMGEGARSVRAYDALADSRVGPLFFQLLRDNRSFAGARGAFAFKALAPDLDSLDGEVARPLGAEQSNTSLVFRDRWIMKAFRKLEPGRNRDVEICTYLSSQAGFLHTPAVAGLAEYLGHDGSAFSLAFLQAYVPNQGDGWSHVLSRLAANEDEAEAVQLTEDLRELGRVTGELHRALAAGTDATFSPEPVQANDLALWSADLHRQANQAFGIARTFVQRVPEAVRAATDRFLQDEGAYRNWIARLAAGLDSTALVKIQIHGDFHLGQVLKTAESFLVIDFEGEPARPVAERWTKQSPVRDVAGMLRSLNYAAHAAERTAPAHTRARLARESDAWEQTAAGAYLDGYRTAVGDTRLAPDKASEFTALSRLFEATKAFYEVHYELNNRPGWVDIPLRGLERLQRLHPL